MKITLAAATMLALLSAPVSAAVSGFYDSAEQINAIFESADVADQLRQAPIGHLANTGTRDDGAIEWEVRTQECDLKVYLTAVPPKGPGKTTYTIADIGTCE